MLDDVTATHYTFQAQAQLELQVAGNNTGYGIGGTGPSITSLLTPNFALTGAFKRWAFEVTYIPVVSVQTYQFTDGGWSAPLFGTLQQGYGKISWKGRNYRISLNEQGGYGRTTYTTGAAAPANAPVAPAQALPVNSILLTASSRTTLDLTQQLSRTVEGYFYAGWNAFTGLDAPTRAELPSQEGPIAGFRISQHLTRLDWFDVKADFTYIDFGATPCTTAVSTSQVPTTAMLACHPVDNLAIATVGVRHKLSTTTEGTLQAGPALSAYATTEGATYGATIYPTWLASVRRTYTYQQAVNILEVTTQMLPIIASQTGAIDYRLIGGVSYDQLGQQLLLHGAVSASESVPFDINGAYFLSRVEGSVGWKFRGSYMTLTGGARFDTQRYVVPATTTTGAVISPEGTILAVLGFVRLSAASRLLGF